MTKLAILFFAAVAFQAAWAGVPRFMEKETFTAPWSFTNTNSMEMIDSFSKMFEHWLEYEATDKDMIISYIKKFMMFMDMLCEKLDCATCTDKVFMDCIMMCKNIKMECEKMLMCTDVHEMKMMLMNCSRTFWMEMKKWCMHEQFFAKLMQTGMMTHFDMMLNFTKSNKDLFMQFEIMYKKFIAYCETTRMDNDKTLDCLRKFMTVLDYTMEMMCNGDKCKSEMIREICMELKEIKMVIERCLGYEVFIDCYKIRMEFCECFKRFYKCMEKWMMCDNCCIGGEMMWTEIFTRFTSFCESVSGKTYSNTDLLVGGYTHQKDLMKEMKMWFEKFMDFCESTHMTKDMMMTYIRKFITVIDFTMEKMCFGGKCHSMMISEICTELKYIKMGLEHCLTFDMHQMTMECMESWKMFYKCMEKIMMCDNCCVGFETTFKQIYTYWIDFCKMTSSGIDVTMTSHTDFLMNMKMLMKKLMACYESGKMSKDMMVMCMHKFVTIIDYTMEKVCFGDKCKDTMMSEICMELKQCKMMMERCLSYGMFTDFYQMKMECYECMKIFFGCMEKWMMCDNCCVGGEMMWKDIYMQCENFYHFVFKCMDTYNMDYFPMTKDYTTMYSMPYIFHRLLKY